MTPLNKELDEILDTTFGQKGTSWHDEAKQRLRSHILRERFDELLNVGSSGYVTAQMEPWLKTRMNELDKEIRNGQ